MSKLLKKNGFTIIELVIIIVIIGITAVVISVSFNPNKTIRLDTAAKKIALDLQYCRSMALTQSKWYGISFQINPLNSYSAYQTDGITDTTLDDPSSTGNNFNINISGNYSGVLISAVNIEGGSKVEFNPLGVPFTDKNGSSITTAGTITLEYSGLTKTINITPNTGFISIP